MLQPRISSSSRRTLLQLPSACLQSQLRLVAPQCRQFTSAPHLRLPASPPPHPSKDETKDPSASEKDNFIPKPLGRPIGFPTPPKAGENTGARVKKTYTGTTMSERNLEKRADIVEKWSQNYFRDFKNIRKYRSGKTFLANARVFKSEAALYFPNLQGATLEVGRGVDTTNVLKGRVSVMRVYSSVWGEAQADTFTGTKTNTELHELIQRNGDVAQIVDVNIEENWLKGLIIKIFQYRLRRQRKKEDWGKYFVIRRGISDRIRETIGLLNGRVGYVYLVDRECKIRWAGSGDAEGTEKDDMTKGLQRLIEEQRGAQTLRPSKPKPKESVSESNKAPEKGIPVPLPIVF